MNYRNRYVAAAIAGGAVITAFFFLPKEAFIAFVMVWLLVIPATFIAYMAFGLREYMKDRKNRIVVSVKPTEAMKALARREEELRREKERLYEELQDNVKWK